MAPPHREVEIGVNGAGNAEGPDHELHAVGGVIRRVAETARIFLHFGGSSKSRTLGRPSRTKPTTRPTARRGTRRSRRRGPTRPSAPSRRPPGRTLRGDPGPQASAQGGHEDEDREAARGRSRTARTGSAPASATLIRFGGSALGRRPRLARPHVVVSARVAPGRYGEVGQPSIRAAAAGDGLTCLSKRAAGVEAGVVGAEIPRRPDMRCSGRRARRSRASRARSRRLHIALLEFGAWARRPLERPTGTTLRDRGGPGRPLHDEAGGRSRVLPAAARPSSEERAHDPSAPLTAGGSPAATR